MSRILKLQKYLKENNINYFIINRTDEFLGEYIAPYAERLKWITGFSGSAGRAIISQERVHLFVDGRYTFQAKEQINCDEISLKHIDTYWDFLKELSKLRINLTIDNKLHSIIEVNKIKNIFKNTNSKIHFSNKNPIDKLWKDQPKYPKSKIYNHPIKYSGISRE